MAESIRWDVEELALSDDGTTIALLVNEDGPSILRILDARSGLERQKPGLAPGRLSNIAFRRKSLEIASKSPLIKLA